MPRTPANKHTPTEQNPKTQSQGLLGVERRGEQLLSEPGALGTLPSLTDRRPLYHVRAGQQELVTCSRISCHLDLGLSAFRNECLLFAGLPVSGELIRPPELTCCRSGRCRQDCSQVTSELCWKEQQRVPCENTQLPLHAHVHTHTHTSCNSLWEEF